MKKMDKKKMKARWKTTGKNTGLERRVKIVKF